MYFSFFAKHISGGGCTKVWRVSATSPNFWMRICLLPIWIFLHLYLVFVFLSTQRISHFCEAYFWWWLHESVEGKCHLAHYRQQMASSFILITTHWLSTAKEPPLKDPDTTFAQQTTSMLTISVSQLHPVDPTFSYTTKFIHFLKLVQKYDD